MPELAKTLHSAHYRSPPTTDTHQLAVGGLFCERCALYQHQLLGDAGRCAYPPKNVTLVLDEEATDLVYENENSSFSRSAPHHDSIVFILSFEPRRADIASGPHAGEYLLPVGM
jgi:hypothetical protein